MNIPFSRRNVLKSTFATALGIITFSTSASAQTSAGDELWRFEPDEDSFPTIWSSPTIVDGTVYIGYMAYNRLYAIDAETGNKQWEFEAEHNIISSPAVVNHTVYIGSVDDHIYALDAEDGTKQWEYETDDSVESSPTVVDGTVYVGSRDSNVYALTSEDGSMEWQYTTGGDITSSPTVADGTVYIGSHDGKVYALNAEDGTKQWDYESLPIEDDDENPQNQVRSSPTVAAGTVYVGSDDNQLYALDAGTGDFIWSKDLGHNVSSSPTVLDGTVYVGTLVSTEEENPDNVYALDADTGDQQWSVQVDYASVRSAPTVVDDTVYIGSYSNIDESFYALNADDGSTEWQFEPDGDIHSSPTVADGTVYIGDRDGIVYALDAGVNGSSEGTRVGLGTLGHHGGWADQADGEIAVETNDATDTSSTYATLNGNLTTLDGYDSSSVYFEWGEHGGNLSNTTDEQTLDSVGEFDTDITDLDSGTGYEFRAVVEANGDTDTGDTFMFRTDDTDPETFAVKTRDATGIDHTVAILNGDLIEIADYDSVTVYFEWGEHGGELSNTTDEQTLDSSGEFDAEITDLETAVDYEFRAVAQANGESDTGDILLFATDEGCFIATAACGTPDHEQVEQLRSFRDYRLKRTQLGRLFIQTYYALSPPVAVWIEQRHYRQVITRAMIVRPAASVVSVHNRIKNYFGENTQ